MTQPTLADVRCTRIRFEPGDRIIVKVYAALDKAQRDRLRATIQKWAGVELQILLVDGRFYDIAIEKSADQLPPSPAGRSILGGLPAEDGGV